MKSYGPLPRQQRAAWIPGGADSPPSDLHFCKFHVLAPPRAPLHPAHLIEANYLVPKTSTHQFMLCPDNRPSTRSPAVFVPRDAH